VKDVQGSEFRLTLRRCYGTPSTKEYSRGDRAACRGGGRRGAKVAGLVALPAALALGIFVGVRESSRTFEDD
jgi:hypothetical protein